MKFKDIFRIGGITQTIGGLVTFLDWDNCKVENKKQIDSAVVLIIKRESDGEEGHAYVRVQDQFKGVTDQLLKWVFVNGKIVGLTLNELNSIDTGLEITSTEGRQSVKF